MAIWVTVSRENLLEARRQVSRSSNDLNQQSGSRNKKELEREIPWRQNQENW